MITAAKLLDVQYLDMNYDQYYFIPWPDSQILLELDPEKENWSYTDPDFPSGAFVSKEWLNELADNGL